MPSLNDLAQNPALAAILTAEQRAALLAQACALIVTLASHGSTPSAAPSPTPERALRVAEAAVTLNMSTDYIYRHWQKLGGFKDADGRVKFAASDLRRHIERARR